MIGLSLLPLLAAATFTLAPAGSSSSVAALVASGDSLPPRSAVRDSVYTLPEIRVESLSEARRRLPTAFVTDVRVGSSGRALETLSDVLAQVAGVHLVQYGGLGAYSMVSLRGSAPGQVSVYLDGVPLTSAAHGIANLADLPITAVERIEVYRGLAPLGLGVPTPGGAINFVTVSSPELRRVSGARGTYDSWDARATLGGSRGPFAGVVHAGYEGSGGRFAFFDDNGTPFNRADDSTSIRVNGRFDAATALATLSWRTKSGFTTRLREDFFRKSQGNPGQGATPARHARLSFERAISQLEAGFPARGSRPEIRLAGALAHERSRARDRSGELGLGNNDTDNRFDADHASLELEWPSIPLGLMVQLVGMTRRERADLHDELDGYPDPPQSLRSTTGGGGALYLRPFGERLTLHAGGRWDRIEDRLASLEVAGRLVRTEVTRRLAAPRAGVRLILPGGFELRANRAEAERAPEFIELFGNQGSVLGNPRLVAEHGRNWDAGGSWSASIRGRHPLAIEWSHFESKARDLILFVRRSAGRDRAENVASAVIKGDEFWIRCGLPWAFALSSSWTEQSARDHGPVALWRDKRLPERPEREAYARLDWAPARFRAGIDAHHIGETFLDRTNRQRVAGRTLIGTSLSWAPSAGLRFSAEAKNLGDDRAADVGGYPLPGRSYFVSCRVGISEPAAHP